MEAGRTAAIDPARTGDASGAIHVTSSAEYVFGGIKKHKLASFVALVFAVALAVGSYFAFLTPRADAITSIAVLPFENASGNADVEYLSDGMTETLIGSLSQIPNLNVKARSSVFRYKGREDETPRIGRELNVQAILTERVVQRGDELTLYLSLIDAVEETNLWSKQYNRRLTNLVALQTEIARDVADNMKTKLSGVDEQKLAKNYTENAEAYQLYLKGRYFWNKRTDKDIRKSIELYEQAIALDPSYALAYVGIADAYCNFNTPSYSLVPSKIVFPKAKEAALKALELDNTLAEAYVPLGFVKERYEWDSAAAANLYQRAIELKPDYAVAHHRYGLFLGNQKRFDESIAELERARQLDPLSLPIATDSSLPYYWSRRYDRAIEVLQKALEMDQNFARIYLFLTNNYREMGRYEEAAAASQKYHTLFNEQFRGGGGTRRTNVSLATIYASAGRRNEALNILEEMDAEEKRGEYIIPTARASIYAALGDKERTLDWLEEAYAHKNSGLVELNVNPLWDKVRDELRFQDLLRRVGFPS